MKTPTAPPASVTGARLASSATSALLAMGIQVLSLTGIAAAAPADLDPAFGTGGRVVFEQSTGSGFESWNQVLPLPNGDALVAGWTQTSTGYVTGRFIVRLNTDGARVSSFGTDGQVTLNLGSSTSGVIDDLLVLPGGKIIAVVSENYALNTKITVFRFQSDGSPDPAFGGSGTVVIDTLKSNVRWITGGMAVDSQGRIILVGEAERNSVAVLRLTADGYLDTSFSGDGMAKQYLAPYAVITSMNLQTDGGIMVAGSVASAISDSNGNLMVCRILADGTLDSNFAVGGKFVLDMHGGSDQASAICLRPNGKILIAGAAYQGDNENSNSLFVGLNQDGSLDASFGNGGIVEDDAAGGLSDSVTAATLMPDGRILASVAVFTSIDPIGVQQFAAVRLMPDGLPDSSFSPGGTILVPGTEGHNGMVEDIARDASGHILVLGNAYNPGGEGGLLVRLQGDPDTDGDGVVDTSETNTGIYVNPFDTGTNPNSWDTDGDGLSDGEEVYHYLTNPTLWDTDSDNVKDSVDAFPLNTAEWLDTDQDGTGDNADTDDDGDGLSDADEVSIHHTNPKLADSDGDGLSDPAELQTHLTDPNIADTDNDGLSDGAEINTYGTLPKVADSDEDGFLDGYEVLTGHLPLDILDKPALVAEARTAIEFTFPAAIGKSYRIEDSPDMTAWGLVEDGIAGTGGVVTRFYTTRYQQKRFFRVEESP